MAMERGLRRILLDFKKHPWLHLVSISTITLSLVFLGAFLLCYRNASVIEEKASPHITGTIYLKEGLSDDDIEAVSQEVLKFDGVVSVAMKRKDTVLSELHTFLGQARDSVKLPALDVFPDVIEIAVARGLPEKTLEGLKKDLASFSNVLEVDFSEDWLAQYARVRNLLAWVGALLGVMIVMGCGFVLANLMGVRHQSRKHEIDVVRLIGANQSFVMMPFLWEGMIEGVVGAVIALGVLYFLTSAFSVVLLAQWTHFLGIDRWYYLSVAQTGLVLLAGVAIATFGSLTLFVRFQKEPA